MQLRDAINLAATAAPRSTTLPILSSLALRADGNAITAIGSNMELGVEITAEFQCQPFEVCVDAEKLKQALTAMPEPTITVSDGRMTIKQGRSRAAIPALPYDSHPGMPDTSGATATIDTDIWHLVDKVAFAAATNDVRYYLNGVLVQSTGTQLVACATDGHRMAVATKDAELPPFSVIIPHRNIKQLLGIRPKTVSIGNCIVGAQGGVRVYSKLVDGKFPDWRRVLVSHSKRLVVKSQELRQALKTIKPFSNTKYMGTHLTWENGALKVFARNEEQAESQVEIECKADTPGEVGVNILYLEEALAGLKESEVSIQFNDPNSPLRFDDDGVSHVVMPMRL